MSIADLLDQCTAAGLTLTLNGTSDGFTAYPASAMTLELRTQLREHKPAVLWRLKCQAWIDARASQRVQAFVVEVRSFRAIADEQGILDSQYAVLLATEAVKQRDLAALRDALEVWIEVQNQHVDRVWPDVDDTASLALLRCASGKSNLLGAVA